MGFGTEDALILLSFSYFPEFKTLEEDRGRTGIDSIIVILYEVV